jgi:hypothetical protein
MLQLLPRHKTRVGAKCLSFPPSLSFAFSAPANCLPALRLPLATDTQNPATRISETGADIFFTTAVTMLRGVIGESGPEACSRVQDQNAFASHH